MIEFTAMVEADGELKRHQLILTEGLCLVNIDTLGGMVMSFTFRGQNIIYPKPNSGDEKTLRRAGIPVLAPVAGPVTGTAWENIYPKMPQHGTRRGSVLSLLNSGHNFATMREVEGPREFLGVWDTTTKIALKGKVLKITETIRNLETKSRERAVAFHPYFDARDGISIIKPKELISLPPINESKILTGFGGFEYKTNSRVKVKVQFNPLPIQVVDWRANDDYRCIEPWWAKPGSGVIFGPLETRIFTMQIGVS